MRPAAAAAALVIMTAGATYFATRQALRSETQVAARPVDSTTMDARKMVAEAIDSAKRAAGYVTRVAPGGPEERSNDRAPRGYPPKAGGSDRGPQSDLPPVVPVSNEPALAETLETVYGREIARLRQIVDQRRPTLDTATVSVIERNLTIIDQAIRESRAALARDPASALLNEKLNNALEQKVELLRAAALLPVRS
jgi:hypothetical protein